jgi:hypothetical protein
MILKFQKHVLSSEVNRQVSSLMRIQEGSSILLYNIASSDAPTEKEREKLLSWISSLQPQLRHQDVKSKRSKGTGAWFLNSATFKAWASCGDIQTLHVLWSVGAPGAGKTILWYVL